MYPTHTDQAVSARDLDGSHVGRSFSYETEDGNVMHARIAMVHVRQAALNEEGTVEITLDGVVHDGNSVILVLKHHDELYVGPSSTD